MHLQASFGMHISSVKLMPFFGSASAKQQELGHGGEFHSSYRLKADMLCVPTTFPPMFRHSVGFDRIQRLMDATTVRTEATYPPYNIETDGEDAYRVTVAVAGFGEDDLDVTLENETLTIGGNKTNEVEDVAFLHRGIAGRNFQLMFNLADHIKVHSAKLENGVLVVDLEREVPEELKSRQIEIQTRPIKSLAKKEKNMISSEKHAA